MAILGHELRNPLAPIVTALQLMKLRDGDAFPRERAIIERQVKHLTRLVDDLLDISRITRGKDDNADAAHLLAEVLEHWGYEVHVAYDGPSGLMLAEKVRPAVALLDIGLPVMDGYELGRRIRSLGGRERIRLVAITGYSQPSDLERSREAGLDLRILSRIRRKRKHSRDAGRLHRDHGAGRRRTAVEDDASSR